MTAPAALPFSPVADAERAGVLDALRGFALLGILISHVPTMSGYEFLAPHSQAALDRFGIDAPLAAVMEFLIRGKFFSLFSLLFGIGFAVQLQSAARRGANFARHFARRLAILLVLGVVHASLWYGDILKDYALIGLVLIATARWHERTVALAAISVLALGIVWPILVAALVGAAAPLPSGSDPGGDFAALTHAFAGADLRADVAANLALVRLKALQIVYDGKAVAILAMFLIGALVGQLGLFRTLCAHRRLFLRVFWMCLPLGVVGNVELVHLHAVTPDFPPTRMWVIEHILFAVAVPAMALAYASGFALLWSRGLRPVLQVLAPAGQMALTTYVSQTLICIALFYGIGVGLHGKVGFADGTLIAMAIFSLQCAMSRVWLRHFRFGPLEWLWRCGTYGKWFPFAVETFNGHASTPVRTTTQGASDPISITLEN